MSLSIPSKHIKCIVLLLFLFLIQNSFSQEKDSLQNYSDKELVNLYRTTLFADINTAKVYADRLFKNATDANDTTKIHEAYKRNAIIEGKFGNYEKALNFIDKSKLIATEDLKDRAMEMSSVYLKGKIFYDFGKYEKAFEHYTIAFDYYADTNKFMAYVTSHNIALIKNVLGDQKGAIKTLKKNYTEYNQATTEETKNFSAVFHANTILALCDSYLRLAIDTEDINKKEVYLDSATTYNQIGFKETKRIDDNYGYSLFLAEKGMISSERGEYTKAIEEINIAYKEIVEQNIKDWLPSVFYYKGISYHKLGKEEEAIDLFKKVDSVSQKNATNYPILQKTYYLLGKIYTNRNDQNNITKYQGLYIKNDQINKHVTKSVIDGIHRSYDIKNLEAQIKKLIYSKEEEKANFNAALTVIIILIFLFLIYLVYNKNKQLQNQLKFDKLLRALEAKKQEVPIKKKSQNLA